MERRQHPHGSSQERLLSVIRSGGPDERNVFDRQIADAGIGIPASMGMNDYSPAIRDVINEGVTRDRTRNAGNGLFGSYQVATLSHGSSEISAGFGLLYRTNVGELVNRSQTAPYQGAALRCRIGLAERGLLDKALRFGDVPHDPPFDYIERRFESDGRELIVNNSSPVRKMAPRVLGQVPASDPRPDSGRSYVPRSSETMRPSPQKSKQYIIHYLPRSSNCV